jgi:hypothetical protein
MLTGLAGYIELLAAMALVGFMTIRAILGGLLTQEARYATLCAVACVVPTLAAVVVRGLRKALSFARFQTHRNWEV